MNGEGRPYLFNARASYQDRLTLFLDISPKDDTIKDFFYEGPKAKTHQEEFEELKKLVLGKKITDLKFLSREELKHEHKTINFQRPIAALSLTLMKEAILQYLGENRTYNQEKDYLCLCFGVTKREIVKEVLASSTFDLKDLVMSTRATSACGSCKDQIVSLIEKTRLENGLIKGLTNSRARVDKEGHWIKILDLYPGPLLVMIDELKNEWMKREDIVDKFSIEFTTIEGLHLDVVVIDDHGHTDHKRGKGLINALTDYLKSQTGVLFFLHLR